METVASAAEKATDLLQKLTLDPKSKTHDAPAVTKKNTVIPSNDSCVMPVLQNIDPNMYYFPNGYLSPYYYGGHDSTSEWEDYSRYMTPDGVEMPTGVYGDMYSGYRYAPYGSYPSPSSPASTMAHDGQLYGPQHYHYPYYQPPSPANTPCTATQAPSSKGEVVSTSASPDQPPISIDAAKANVNGVANAIANGNNGSVPPKAIQQHLLSTSNGSYGRGGALPKTQPTSGYYDPRYSNDGMRSPVPWYDGSVFPSPGSHITNTTLGRNQNPTPHTFQGLQNQRPVTPAMMHRMYPNSRMYNAFRSNYFDSRSNGRWGVVDSKYKLDGLSELNRGPRVNRFKDQKGSVVMDREQYNKEEFPVDYTDAKFFIIKSYSEDDLHKSVKYNVWASTPNGNKKLDAAYKEAQEKPGACPVFLFFSVNTSGQFVGVAEMVGPVDFNKTVDYWQQDKWTGCFAVKWHIVKDVPNSILKHIILENNENKPVTNSRDTQEVKLEQGLQMIKLFKEHVSKTSILDDFEFYEIRQKVMQDKRAKQQQLRKQVGDIIEVKSTDGALKREVDLVGLGENGVAVVVSGVANGC